MADILSNPKARRDYHILETYEAGIALHGTEVKSARAGKLESEIAPMTAADKTARRRERIARTDIRPSDAAVGRL